MQNLTRVENIENLISRSEILLLQFGSPTCAPCRAIRNKIDLWSKNHQNVTTRYITIEDFADLAAYYGIYSAPTILVFVDGKRSIMESGYFSMESVFQKIERYLQILYE